MVYAMYGAMTGTLTPPTDRTSGTQSLKSTIKLGCVGHFGDAQILQAKTQNYWYSTQSISPMNSCPIFMTSSNYY